MEIINFKIEKQEYLHHFYLDDGRFEGTSLYDAWVT